MTLAERLRANLNRALASRRISSARLLDFFTVDHLGPFSVDQDFKHYQGRILCMFI